MSKQASEQKGPGTRNGSFNPTAPSSPSPKPTATNPSGSTQGQSRGKQG